MQNSYFKIKNIDGKTRIFDPIRKKYIVLTPEEKVRQETLFHLIENMKYPKGIISVEKELKFNNKRKRTDIVVYKDNLPWLIVECKASTVKINQKTFDQIALYNLTLQVPYLYITNGLQHYIFNINWKEKTYSPIQALPSYF